MLKSKNSKPENQTPTIGSIAQLAGVSTATVSYALSGSGRVSAKKAQEINAIAKQVGYVPQHSARALRKGQTSVVGLVVPNITNPIFTAMAQAIDECLHENGYGVLLADSKNRRQGQDEAIRNLTARGADALIVIPRHDTAVISCNKKVVVIDVTERQEDSVSSDHQQGGELIAQHLVDFGHRHLLIMAGPKNSAVAQARLSGMMAVLEQVSDMHTQIHHSQYGPDAADAIMSDIDLQSITAVAAVSDTLAVGALRYLTRNTIPIPQKISVSGFDDTIWTEICTPSITTVHQNVLEIARRVSAIAIGREHGSVTIPVSLVVRESTGPADVNFIQK
jgi:LacI family transcriptional regulator